MPKSFRTAAAPDGATGLRPTPEQQLCIDAFRTGDHMVITAGAGTGKTSTLRMIGEASQSEGLYVAYNKAIAEEAQRRFPSNVICKTAHSYAYGAVGKHYRPRLNGDRIPPRETARALHISQEFVAGTKRLSTSTLARLVMEMVGNFCNSADRQITLAHRPFVEGLVDADGKDLHDALAERLLPFAVKAWEDLQRPTGQMQFSHDHYLKIWQLGDPVLDADFILFDEAQDANPVIASIVGRQDAQRVFVGDQAQAIYGWRGATDAMATFEGTQLWLSQSFRFGQPIAEEANQFLEQLATPLRLTGNPAKASQVVHKGVPLEPRAVLTRTNATAIERLLNEQDAGTKVHLQGGGQQISAFCRGVDDLRERGSSTHRDLVAFSSWGEVQDYVQDEKGELATWVKVVDRYGTTAIVQAVQRMHHDEPSAELTISTAHKAKGREWSSVEIAEDFEQRKDKEGEPVPLSDPDLMLRYVAVTRAEQVLALGPLSPELTAVQA